MKKLTVTFYSDSGHGWCKAPLSLVKSLGIAEDISTYSYVRNAHVYLEEDRDASIFFKALKEKNVEVKVKECNTDKRSKIRSYGSYNHTKIDWSCVE